MQRARACCSMVLFIVVTTGCGGGSGSPTGPSTSTTSSTAATQPQVSADLPVATPSASGVYGDGLGTYPPGNVYLTPDGANVFIQPQCPGSSRPPSREMNLILPQTALAVVTARPARCGSYGIPGEQIYLHVPNPSRQQPGAVIGAGGAPPNANISPSVFLFLDVDSDGDGRISAPPDEHYNIRWQRGIYFTRRSETATATAYELTSLANEFGPDVSCSAELILGNTPLGEISKGLHCLPLVLTITVQK